MLHKDHHVVPLVLKFALGTLCHPPKPSGTPNLAGPWVSAHPAARLHLCGHTQNLRLAHGDGDGGDGGFYTKKVVGVIMS